MKDSPSNNAFERTVMHSGPRPSAARRWWPADVMNATYQASLAFSVAQARI